MNEIELFHGSRNEFQEFDMARIAMTMYGWGFNFTTDLDFAHDFGDKIYTIELPDDSKFLDFENTDMGDEIFKKFCEDIENHGISKEFIDMSGTDGSFKEAFWMMETNYVKLLGLSKEDAMKRLTEIVKTFGFLGSKYKDIYVIYDKENMKIKNVRKLDESFNFSNISKKVIKESLSNMVYHFTTFKSFYDMVDKDVIQFSLAGGLSDKYLNGTYGNGAKYFLSTTRVRDGRFGYSQGLNVRLEINSDAFNSNFSAGPVDFFYKSKFIKNPEKLKMKIPSKFDATKDEAEDRIFSNKPEVHNLAKYVRRVDILFDNGISPKEFEMLRDIYNSPIGLQTFVYDNRMEFNRQGKNITLQLVDKL